MIHDAFPLRPGRTSSFALLVVVAACLFFIGLGRLPLVEPDEGRNAEVAREMIVSHHWITPRYDTLPYLDKPALFFWMIAECFRGFGLSEWSARFPSAILALATVLLVWGMTRKMLGRKLGLEAGIILATSPLFFGFARFVIFDMPLTFFVSIAMFCFWLSSESQFSGAGLDLAAFAAMGIATLIKGPVGFLLPLLTLLAYHALLGKFRNLRKVHWTIGWAVFLAITLPWFIAISLRNPGFPHYALWNESLLRFASGTHLNRAKAAWYYIPIYFAGFFPWSFFLFFAVWNRLKRWRELRKPLMRPVLFLLAWIGVVFIFFSISHSKLPGYFLPALVPLAILTALVWPEAGHPDGGGIPRWMSGGFAAMMILGAVAAAASFFRLHGIEAHLARRIPMPLIAQLRSSLLTGGVILFALGFLGRNTAMRSRRRGARGLALAVVALTVPLLVIRWRAPIRNYFNIFSSRQLAGSILRSPDRNLTLYGYYYFRTSLPFYLRRPVGLVTADGDETTSNYVVARFRQLRTKSLRFHAPQAPLGWVSEPVMIDARKLNELAQSAPGPFLLLAQNNEAGDLIGVVGAIEPLWTAWKYTVWKKRAGAGVVLTCRSVHSGSARFSGLSFRAFGPRNVMKMAPGLAGGSCFVSAPR